MFIVIFQTLISFNSKVTLLPKNVFYLMAKTKFKRPQNISFWLYKVLIDSGTHIVLNLGTIGEWMKYFSILLVCSEPQSAASLF